MNYEINFEHIFVISLVLPLFQKPNYNSKVFFRISILNKPSIFTNKCSVQFRLQKNKKNAIPTQ